mmetsp:Transcript_2918/g.6875  ORF Transcript_2918/g.6875 Transcript_2918/m.6875 type:complete len:105 (+) Transcript_2918:887-1201(+)
MPFDFCANLNLNLDGLSESCRVLVSVQDTAIPVQVLVSLPQTTTTIVGWKVLRNPTAMLLAFQKKSCPARSQFNVGSFSDDLARIILGACAEGSSLRVRCQRQL